METTVAKQSNRQGIGILSRAERDQLIIRYAPWVKFIAMRMAAKLPSHIQAGSDQRRDHRPY